MKLQNWATVPITVLVIADRPDQDRIAGLLPPGGEHGITLRQMASLGAARALDPEEQINAVIVGGSTPLETLEKLAGTAAGDAPALVLLDRAEGEALAEAIAAGAVDALPRDDLSTALLRRALRYAASSRSAERVLARLELFDDATGLPRQTLFWEILNGAVRRASRDDSHLAVLLLQLDGLPHDVPGEPLATDLAARRDRVVADIGRRLTASLRARDTVARFEATLLAIIIEGLATLEDMQGLAERVIEQATAVLQGEATDWQANVALGIALYPTAGLTPEGLVSAASRAMVQAQAQGPNRFLFD